MSNNKYTITLTEKQLSVVFKALEWFFRLQMGQFFDYATEIAQNGYVYDKSAPNNEADFNAYIWRRNEAQEQFQKAFRIAQPRLSNKTEDMLIAEDIWQCIRYKQWLDKPEPKTHGLVDSDPPLFVSPEQPISIELADETPEYQQIVSGLRREVENTRANYLYSLLHNAANAIETLSRAEKERNKK